MLDILVAKYCTFQNLPVLEHKTTITKDPFDHSNLLALEQNTTITKYPFLNPTLS